MHHEPEGRDYFYVLIAAAILAILLGVGGAGVLFLRFEAQRAETVAVEARAQADEARRQADAQARRAQEVAIQAESLDGTWQLVAGTDDGKVLPAEVVRTGRLVIHGNEHTLHLGAVQRKGMFTLTPTAKPKLVDAADVDGPFKGKPRLGIYELNGNELKISLSAPGEARALNFTDAHAVRVWKRVQK